MRCEHVVFLREAVDKRMEATEEFVLQSVQLRAWLGGWSFLPCHENNAANYTNSSRRIEPDSARFRASFAENYDEWGSFFDYHAELVSSGCVLRMNLPKSVRSQCFGFLPRLSL